MAKTCETCSNNILERGWEDYDQYCLKGIDMNKIPEPEDNPSFKCSKWKKIKN